MDRRRVHGLKARLRQFDERFGVETYVEVTPADLGIGSPKLQANGYVAVSQENFALAMATLDIRHEDFVFVDLGSGKGKALFLASEYPFEQIIGVELSPALHQVAVGNVARYSSPTQRCQNIRSICQDATDFEFPLRPLVVFLYNPFGPDILRNVLDRLELSLAGHPRPCMVVLVYPLWAQVVRERGHFVECAASRFFTTFRYRADARAQASVGGT